MNTDKCAPGIKNDGITCIQKMNVLVNLIEAYNSENPKSKIEIDKKKVITDPLNYKKHLIAEMENRMSGKCSTQLCWTEQDFVQKMNNIEKMELQYYTFRPKNKEGWLDTRKLLQLMKQYEDVYSDFLYMGTVPIDFDSLPGAQLSTIDLDKWKEKGKVKYGAIFNLAPVSHSGTHWVAMYADIQKCEIYFFDSAGKSPKIQISNLMTKFYNYCEKTNKGKEIIMNYNTTRHQKGKTECGTYSANFILRLLRGDKFEDICKNRIPDEIIKKCRNVYFN